MKAPKEVLLLSHFIPLLLLLPHSVLSSDPPFSCDSSNTSTKIYRFCNTLLPIRQRVEDLITHLSLEEKISQLGDRAPPIPRLGIPGYKWWSESLHGVSGLGGIHYNGSITTATSFPQVILTAASFDTFLWYRIGEAIGTEARAIYNNGQAEGLTFWAPNINIFRDPRWGRGQETPGEDPMMAGKYAISYVRGLQGDSFLGKGTKRSLKASACCKHFTAYDLDRWKGVVRYSFNAEVSVQDLEDTYQPPFKSCVEEGHASGIMCSYNQLNGVPTCADYNLLTKTARGLWGFDGYITSDCDAVSVIYTNQKYAKTPEDAVAETLKAGMDVNCGEYVQNYSYSAIKQGKLSENDIDRALHNLFTMRMRLGLFNGSPKQLLYGNIAPKQVCSSVHQSLSLEAARDGIVLLKNSEKFLPFDKSKVTSLGVIGPNANNAKVLLGNYYGPPCISKTPLQVLQSYVKDTRYIPGCDTALCNSSHISEAVELASSVDYVIMFMGLDQTLEREDFDREDLVLPGMQPNLIASVAGAAKRPVILVVLCGGPVDIESAKVDDKIGGILWAGYPGEAGGLAIAEVIFGEHNPGGRLPVTWYPQEFTRVAMTDMRMRSDAASRYPGRTYRFYTGKSVFSFGYGLSYSTFSYKFKSKLETNIFLNKSIDSLQSIKRHDIISYDISGMSSTNCEKLELSSIVGVENNGPMDGKHTVLLFLRKSSSAGGRPMKQLIGFQRVSLRAGERVDVEFVLKPCEHFAHTEEDGRKMIDKGSHLLVVGEEELEFNFMV
ncbi:putative beta-D-xylosidase 7 [Apostasia shenzhenica]|uniref:Putative beta-D-xylosidase 7 n=1 Tax=Apostasia shenzhenica TaxID=1088818 RepID=A0A2I0AR97_9ASPA|nr:putative beta-D-xylosidase 7 [Apostasia shenzhenica]